MVTEVEALPEDAPRYCTTCMEPLTWIHVFHLNRNVAVVPLGEPDRFSFRIHTCALPGPARTWRHVQKVAPETTRRGARRARLAIAEAKAKSGNEKEV